MYETIGELLIHEITPGVTMVPPPGVDSPEQDSNSIALIIMWTLIIFVVGLFTIAFMKSRCGGEDKKDPFTYKAPSESLFAKFSNRRSNSFGKLSEMELSNSSIGNRTHGNNVSNPMNNASDDSAY